MVLSDGGFGSVLRRDADVDAKKLGQLVERVRQGKGYGSDRSVMGATQKHQRAWFNNPSAAAARFRARVR